MMPQKNDSLISRPVRLRTPVKRMEVGDTPKRSRKQQIQLPESVLDNKDPQQAEDLIQGYRILHKLLSARNVGPFLERPDENECDIMASYYDEIEEPMWFNEVKEKYLNGAYLTLPEFVLDVRLIFANCFRFHGPKSPLTKVALQLEKILEQELALLPADTQAVCSLESTHRFREEDLVYKKDGVTSRLLQWVVNEQSEKEMEERDELPLNARKEQQENLEKELVSWENGILYAEQNVQDTINSMFELPQIGVFLLISSGTFNIEKISQYEVERMFLAPQFSKSLATIMTCLLSTRKDKSKVLYGPPMPYEVWAGRLCKKVASWYKLYHTKQKKFVDILNTTGIEHMFWLVMGEPNPLERFQFHELLYQKKVWIMKTLCDNIMHTHKSLHDLVSHKSALGYPEVLGEDRKGNTYLHFPVFSDLRVYKQAKSLYTKFNINRWEKLIQVPVAKDDEDSLPHKSVLPSKSDFELVASTVAELKSLYNNLIETEFPAMGNCDNKNSTLLQNIDKLLQENSKNESKYMSDVNHTRQKMYAEWKCLFDRLPESLSADILFWENDAEDKRGEEDFMETKTEINGQPKNSHLDEPPEAPILESRERKSKTESHVNMKMMALNEARGESDTSDDSEDLYGADSGEEWVSSQSKRKAKQSTVKRKRRALSKNSQDAAQAAVEKNMKMNEELEKQKKDEKAQRLNPTNTIKRDNDVILKEPKIQLKCIDPNKLMQNLSGISIKNEPVKVIENLVAPEKIKAEGKPESPEMISIDDDDDDSLSEKKTTENRSTRMMINMPLRLDQSPSRLPVTPRLPSPIDDDIQVLQTSKSPVIQSPGVYPPNLSSPQQSTRLPSPIITQGLYAQNSHLHKQPNNLQYPKVAQFLSGPPLNNMTPVKQSFPGTKGPAMNNLRARLSSPRMRSPGIVQQTFRGMAPHTVSPRVPNQMTYSRHRFRQSSPSLVRSPSNYSPRTPIQQRAISSSASTPRRQYTPSPSEPLNSRPLSHSAPSKTVSNILNSVAVANSLSAGKKKSSLLNSITITPINNSAVTITPVLPSANQAKKVSRNLNFGSPNKKRLVYIKGTVVLDSDFCYSVQIPNGRKFKLTPQQLEECRGNNNGVMPTTISIPVPEDVANLLEPEVVEID